MEAASTNSKLNLRVSWVQMCPPSKHDRVQVKSSMGVKLNYIVGLSYILSRK